jgi:hypothetical protein
MQVLYILKDGNQTQKFFINYICFFPIGASLSQNQILSKIDM